MRFSTESRKKLQFLIEFIRIWYTAKEWAQESGRLLDAYRRTAVQGRLAEAGRFVEHLEYLAEGAPSMDLGYAVADATVTRCIMSRDFKRADRKSVV